MTPGEIKQTKFRANAIDRASTVALNGGVILPLAGLTQLPARFAVADVVANAYTWGTAADALRVMARGRAMRETG